MGDVIRWCYARDHQRMLLRLLKDTKCQIRKCKVRGISAYVHLEAPSHESPRGTACIFEKQRILAIQGVGCIPEESLHRGEGTYNVAMQNNLPHQVRLARQQNVHSELEIVVEIYRQKGVNQRYCKGNKVTYSRCLHEQDAHFSSESSFGRPLCRTLEAGTQARRSSPAK